jgi:adenine-specific DNA-methyltransferase
MPSIGRARPLAPVRPAPLGPLQQAFRMKKRLRPFTALTPWPGDLVCAEGRYMEGDTEKRAAIFIGPEFGTVQRTDLVAAAREAGDAAFDVLIACAFNYEAHTTEFSKLGRIPVLKARMNADLHMAEDLKNTGKGVEAHAGIGRVELQVEGRRLHGLLLIPGQSGEAVSENVGDAEFHDVKP